MVMVPGWLGRSVRIAWIEVMCARRKRGRPRSLRLVLGIALIALSIGCGIGAYGLGAAVYRDLFAFPLETMRMGVTMGFLTAIVVFAQATSRQLERAETDLLLTTVTVREFVVGIALAVYSRVALPWLLPVCGGAIGFAAGVRSPATAVAIAVAVGGGVTLAAVIGAVIVFAKNLVPARITDVFRQGSVLRYALIGVIWLIGSVVVIVFPLDRVTELARRAPSAWLVDLGLIAVPEINTEAVRGLGALVVLAVGIPGSVIAAVAIADRVLDEESDAAELTSGSRSLVGDGLSRRLFGRYVSRPTLTVARKRWVQERRISLAFFMAICFPMFGLSGIVLYALSVRDIPPIALVSLAFVCATGVGQGFGSEVLGAEYPVLPMTLTSASGREFVRGTVLAAVAVGAPPTALLTLGAGLVGSVGVLEAVLITVASVAWCCCSAAVATALGMDVRYRDIYPMPYPFTSAMIYGEIGRASFIRLGLIGVALTAVCLPAAIASVPSVTEAATAVLGIPAPLVRSAAVLLTIGIALAVSKIAVDRAVESYAEYTLR
ncbi:hypothetical protein JMJ58_10065 [Haloterrigena salifodinae]|uniref:Uncharacterized protein n=1 Tax=Haloterrigena salifodinae TaxID=2675099 RepID=A0A8T8E5N8_9EURY|nr:hypothetical protein [Haloterrigena salifodinae]QRV17185.1 hypothetical protein JMJ58_10065 [Haloterrigena salifodinae]